MAIKSTVFKATLQIADMDRYYYADHALTLALHPSETEERMMVRLLAFALYADEALAFGRASAATNEPDLWQKRPDRRDRALDRRGAARRACNSQGLRTRRSGRGHQLRRAANIWWNENRDKLQRLNNLTVLNLPSESTQALVKIRQPHDAAAMLHPGRPRDGDW